MSCRDLSRSMEIVGISQGAKNKNNGDDRIDGASA